MQEENNIEDTNVDTNMDINTDTNIDINTNIDNEEEKETTIVSSFPKIEKFGSVLPRNELK